jgi:hypothetical protein
MDLVANFAVETVAGLVGVFTGVVLALRMERRRLARAASEAEAAQQRDLAMARKLVVTSVVKNTSEAKRVRPALESGSDPYLFRLVFETAVWEATREQFVRIAPLDERVALASFFDQLRRLVRYVDFLRDVRAQLEVSGVDLDDGDRALLEDIHEQLCDAADDVRLDGVVVVTDLGDAMHRRLLGMPAPDDAVSNEA